MKTCPICHEIKELSDFPKNKQTKDGTNTYCKKCMYQKYGKPWAKKNPDKVKEGRLKWAKLNPEKVRFAHNKSQKKFAKNHREIMNQRSKRYYANHPKQLVTRKLVMMKKLPMGNKCEVCNATEKLVRHHPDYSKPYLTITLCQTCHFKTHGKLRK